jgi:hypothetical protein
MGAAYPAERDVVPFSPLAGRPGRCLPCTQSSDLRLWAKSPKRWPVMEEARCPHGRRASPVCVVWLWPTSL